MYFITLKNTIKPFLQVEILPLLKINKKKNKLSIYIINFLFF